MTRLSTCSIGVAASIAVCLAAIAPIQAHSPQGKSEAKPVVEYLNRDKDSTLPFSDAVRVGPWLILSGKIGTDESGKVVPGGIKAETKQTMENIKEVLEAYGA